SLMPDGKVIQMGTSHHLGDNFAKAFNIRYLDKKGQLQYVFQTSWAETTRVIGALIMSHGDDQGLVLPPKITPIQVIIIPVSRSDAAVQKCDNIRKELEADGIRVKIDNREEKTVGWKFNEWELKGVPIRIEVGENEIKNNELTIYRRDLNQKYISNIKDLLDEIQKALFEKMKKFREENTHEVSSYDEFKEIMKTKKGLIYAFWCEDANCEAKIKAETKASTRVLPLDAKKEQGRCIYCGKVASHRWYFAQAY
ncbi:proline--tRNA ligase, partial [Candidatus Gottesmanbacteria bacterium]|nr:proline--tRNA ligase [Candidatus Gottesmanbacteria bacterium]